LQRQRQKGATIMTPHLETSITRLLAAVTLAIMTLVSGCAQAPTLDDGVAKATQLYKQEDYDGVIRLLEPIATRDPNMSTTSWDLLGMAHFRKHQYRQAAAALEKATAPGMFSGMPFGGRRSDMNSNGWLGWSYFHLQDYAKARAAFNKALAKSEFRRNPGWDEHALRGRGWVRYFQGDFQGAGEDISNARRIAQASPGLFNQKINFDQSLAMTYINLALNRDEVAQDMVNAAMDAAKIASLPANRVKREVAPVYLMLGQRDRAYQLWGGKAALGIGMQDIKDGVSRGARIVEVLDGSAAQSAGLMEGDVIVALDGKPVAEYQEVLSQISTRQPGQNVELALLRNGSPIKVSVTLAGPDALIAKSTLLQPVLKVRQLPAAMSAGAVLPSDSSADRAALPPEPAVAGTSTVVVDMPPFTTEVSVPQVETPVPPELRIESAKVEPDPVPAGESFQVKMKVFVLDQDVREETVAVVLRYAISKDGKELARFAPGNVQVPNGVPSPLSYTTRATKTPGDYTIHTELEMGSLEAQMETDLRIR
jgi:tetratricopeptide (TPR) repeat protein